MVRVVPGSVVLEIHIGDQYSRSASPELHSD